MKRQHADQPLPELWSGGEDRLYVLDESIQEAPPSVYWLVRLSFQASEQWKSPGLV
jgi:hypothetical protein